MQFFRYPLPAALAALCLLASCATEGGEGRAAADSRPAVPSAASARLADLGELVRGLESRHPALRGRAGAARRAELEAGAAELGARLPVLRGDQALVELARLVASLGDGHTSLVVPAYARLPLELYRFEEGWYVIGAAAECRALLGTRLLAIGGLPIEEVAARLAPAVSHDNASGLASQLAYRLVMPELLAGVGVLEPGARAAEIEAVDGAGSRLAASLRFWRFGEAVPEMLSLEPPAGAAISRSRSGEAYWCSLVPGTRSLYIAYNRCREDPKRPLGAFAREVDSILGSGAADRVLVDLRSNGGGSSPLFWPLLRVLAAHARGRGAVPVYVAIGRRTFSSAVLNAVELVRGQAWPFSLLAPSAAATLVGEASGGRPNHYGSVKSFTLPESGLRVQYSTMKFDAWPGDPEALEPEIAAPPTWADFASGRDPCLEAVLAAALPAEAAK